MARWPTPDWERTGLSYRALHRGLRAPLVAVCRLRARGVENLPRDGPAIVVANHHSYLDPLALGAVLPRPLRFLGKKEVFVGPFRRLFRNAGAIPVDRQRGSNREAMAEALEVLARGDVVALYPEATLVQPSSRGPYKSGAAVLAHLSGAPVVPVGALTHRVLPGYAWFPRLGRRALVNVGAARAFPRLDDPDRATLDATIAAIMADVHRLHEEAAAADARGERWR